MNFSDDLFSGPGVNEVVFSNETVPRPGWFIICKSVDAWKEEVKDVQETQDDCGC